MQLTEFDKRHGGMVRQDSCLKDSVIGRLSGFSDGWMTDLMCGSCLDAFTLLNNEVG